MIEDIVGNNGTRFVIAAGAVALGLLCLVAVMWFIRNRPSSPFIRGGKNRQPRLAVLDAAAIDTRRRLVLVRRDDVEHLIMIGGPTDVVIESRIVAQAAPQMVATTAMPETVVARPSVERRPAPQPETRAAAPVSAMGQVLYGENAALPSVEPTRPSPARPMPEAARAPAERSLPVQPPQRPQVVTANAAPAVAIETARSPEDILEAARSRVLAANQPGPMQRPQPLATPTVATTPSPVPAGIEFERLLDAEISGNLSQLTADDVRVDGDQRPVPGAASRQDPRFGNTPGGRTEPTLEDEMNRMLNEIAVSRKN